MDRQMSMLSARSMSSTLLQIEKEVQAFSRSSRNVRSCIVVGGVNMSEQRGDLRQVSPNLHSPFPHPPPLLPRPVVHWGVSCVYTHHCPAHHRVV